MTVLSNRDANIKSQGKLKRQKQQQQQNRSPETNLKQMETSDLSGQEFKITVIKMLTKVSRAKKKQNKKNLTKQ